MGVFDFFKEKQEEPAPKKRGFPRMRIGRRFMDGAANNRLTSDWSSTPITADSIVGRHQRILVARSREQVANNDYAKAFVRMCRQNIVGNKGVMLQAQSKDDKGALDTLANNAIEEAWDAWSHRDSCDIAGIQSWRSLQASCVMSAVKDGEFMLRKIVGKESGPFGFALQVLDPQRCNPQFDRFDFDNGNFIRSGIEFNKWGKPLAYHFQIESERDAVYAYNYGGTSFIRAPADEIIHGFLPEIVGQKRGLPWMATGLYRLRMLKGFEDAALVNARIGASKMGVIQWKDGRGPEMDDEDRANFEMNAEPGEFSILPEGAELSEWNPQYPSGEFMLFNKAMLRGISAGFGVLYNNLANDLENVNFSSIRQGTLDEREHWKEMQEWLIECLVQPVFEAWLPLALLGGHIAVNGRPLKAERLKRYARVAWQARRWQWIDPRADVDAAIAAKNQLLLSPSQIIREQGRDPSDVWREIACDIEEMKKAGIPEDFIKSAIFDKNLQAAAMMGSQDAASK